MFKVLFYSIGEMVTLSEDRNVGLVTFSGRPVAQAIELQKLLKAYQK